LSELNSVGMFVVNLHYESYNQIKQDKLSHHKPDDTEYSWSHGILDLTEHLSDVLPIVPNEETKQGVKPHTHVIEV